MNDNLDLQSILGEQPTSPKLQSLIQKLAALANPPISSPAPDVKSYSDTIYHNYYEIGISLMFTSPTKGSKSSPEQFVCDSIDVMNVPDAEAGNTRAAKTASPYRAFPNLPLALPKRDTSGSTSGVASTSDPTSNTPFLLKPTSTGAEFVQCFGEPARKGGGAGTAGPGIWCEWSTQGLMVEFGGDEARGPNAWEQGGKAVWSVLTIFRVV